MSQIWELWRRWKFSKNTPSPSTSLRKEHFWDRKEESLIKGIFLGAVPGADRGLSGSDSTAWVKASHQVLWPRREWGFIYYHGNHACLLPWAVASAECCWGFLCYFSLLTISHPQWINHLPNPSMFRFLGHSNHHECLGRVRWPSIWVSWIKVRIEEDDFQDSSVL